MKRDKSNQQKKKKRRRGTLYIVVMMINGRNGVEEMRRKRNVAREKVESSNECFGVLLLVLFLLFIHGYGGREI
jgi:hypothetical protein